MSKIELKKNKFIEQFNSHFPNKTSNSERAKRKKRMAEDLNISVGSLTKRIHRYGLKNRYNESGRNRTYEEKLAYQRNYYTRNRERYQKNLKSRYINV
jgi:hypothetical protein